MENHCILLHVTFHGLGVKKLAEGSVPLYSNPLCCRCALFHQTLPNLRKQIVRSLVTSGLPIKEDEHDILRLTTLQN